MTAPVVRPTAHTAILDLQKRVRALEAVPGGSATDPNAVHFNDDNLELATRYLTIVANDDIPADDASIHLESAGSVGDFDIVAKGNLDMQADQAQISTTNLLVLAAGTDLNANSTAGDINLGTSTDGVINIGYDNTTAINIEADGPIAISSVSGDVSLGGPTTGLSIDAAGNVQFARFPAGTTFQLLDHLGNPMLLMTEGDPNLYIKTGGILSPTL